MIRRFSVQQQLAVLAHVVRHNTRMAGPKVKWMRQAKVS